MDKGPISPNTHGAIEPLAALIIALSPWIFGFSGNDTATTIAVIVGVAMLAGGMATQWRPSLVKLIPLRMHFAWDLLIAAVLILAPFVLGFNDDGGATRFFVIAGVLEALTALSTRWSREEVDHQHSVQRGNTARA